MGKTCVVLHCNSIENEQDDSSPVFFQLPKDPNIFQKWKSNIPNTKEPLTVDSFICENHFLRNDVITSYGTSLLEDKWTVLSLIKTLKSTAVPMLFSVQTYENNESKNSKLNVKIRQIKLLAPEIIDNNITKVIQKEHMYSRPACADQFLISNSQPIIKICNKSLDDNLIDKISNNCDKYSQYLIVDEKKTNNVEKIVDNPPVNPEPVEKSIVEDIVKEKVIVSEPLTFDWIKSNISTIKLPNNEWHTFVSPLNDMISFYIIQFDTFLRRINIFPDLSYRVCIDRIIIPDHYYVELTSLDVFVEFLWSISYWNLCETFKEAKKYIPLGSCEGIAPRFTNVGPPRKKCINCNVRWELEYIELAKKPTKNPKNHINSSRTIESLDAKIGIRRDACIEMEEEALERIISKLTEKQKILIRECVAAAKKKDIKLGNDGVQDNLKWAYKCMMTRYQGSTVYDYLKEHESLPLPSRNLLNKYIGLFI